MKKSIKRLITVLAVCAVSAFAVVASGCNVTDKIKEKIEQARCEHEWNDGEVTKEATCMEKGELTKTCTLCEKVETEEIELAEHTAVYVQAVAPTCLEKGVTDGTVCSVCEAKISGLQEIPALGHIVVKDKAVEPTCLESGLTEGEHCSRCNEIFTAQEKVPATGHNLVILEAVESTCTTEGKTQGVSCSSCKQVFAVQETVAKKAHIDEDGNLFCDECNIEITETMDMTEVAVEVGEKVVGNWYRLYKTSDWSSIIFDEVNVQFFANDYENDTHGYVKDPVNNLPFYNLVGFKIVETDGYIDFYFEEGTYEFIKVDGSETEWTFVVDDSLVVSRLNGSVYRLV